MMGIKKLHYAWVTVLVGFLTIFSCIGIGRLSYGMILPSMGKNLGLGYALMGYVGTGNFCGYLTGVALAPFVLARFGGRKATAGGLLLISLSLVSASLSQGFIQLIISYTLTGIGSGIANIPAMVVIGRWFKSSMRGKATGFMLAGNSLAIVFAGFFVPLMNGTFGESGWRAAWGTMAAVVFLVSGVVGIFLREHPSDKGLEPLGETGASHSCAEAKIKSAECRERQKNTLLRLGSLYFIFGLTHVVYVTFFVTSLVKEHGLAEASAGKLWAWVGIFGFASGPLLGGFSDRAGRMYGMAALFGLQTISYLMAGAGKGEGAVFASIALYGLAAWASPTIISAAVADNFPLEQAARAFSITTFCLAVGQIAGPAIAGRAAEAAGTFSPVFLGLAAITAAASLFCVAYGAREKATAARGG